jgi:hypothetical protein
VSGPKDATAGFGTPPPPPPPKDTLTVLKAGTGTGYVGGNGGIDCGPTCSVAYSPSSQVKLLAVADDGSTFTGWSGGGCSGGADSCTVTISADTQVTATFAHVDREPPHIQTLKTSGRPGTSVGLRFRVYDDSGQSRELLTILHGKTTVGSVSVPLGKVRYRQVYTARWRVPRSAKPGQALYCAVAVDPAGNRSKRSCSAFTVT